MTYDHRQRPPKYSAGFWLTILLGLALVGMTLLAIRNAQPLNCDSVRHEEHRIVCEVWITAQKSP